MCTSHSTVCTEIEFWPNCWACMLYIYSTVGQLTNAHKGNFVQHASSMNCADPVTILAVPVYVMQAYSLTNYHTLLQQQTLEA